jgi:hypothetical protein
MVGKARLGVAILEVPDAALKQETLALRYRVAGGKAEYEKRYNGLQHLYFNRDWLDQTLRRAGANAVAIHDQEISDYGNASGRFNAFAQVRSP